MQLIFEKNENEISSYISSDEVKSPFDYVEFIKKMYFEAEIQEPKFIGEFSSDEKESLLGMWSEISLIISERADQNLEIVEIDTEDNEDALVFDL